MRRVKFDCTVMLNCAALRPASALSAIAFYPLKENTRDETYSCCFDYIDATYCLRARADRNANCKRDCDERRAGYADGNAKHNRDGYGDSRAYRDTDGNINAICHAAPNRSSQNSDGTLLWTEQLGL